MKNLVIQLSFIFTLALFIGPFLNAQDIAFELSEEDKKEINDRIAIILENDQKFRKYMGSGTMDAGIHKQKDALLKGDDVQGYFAFIDSLNLDPLPPKVEKSLYIMQHHMDSLNLIEFIDIVDTYGYPSRERLGVKADNLFIVLLHPAVEKEEIPAFQERMFNLLLPEVKAKRMDGKTLALFYDNMNAKILRLPQLYGTNQQMDRKTNKILPPIIEDLDKSNEARKAIGMELLKEGEYRLAKDTET